MKTEFRSLLWKTAHYRFGKVGFNMGYKISPEQEARILDAMRYAGEMIKHARDEGHEHFSVWSKAGDSNFVTSCDLY